MTGLNMLFHCHFFLNLIYAFNTEELEHYLEFTATNDIMEA